MDQEEFEELLCILRNGVNSPASEIRNTLDQITNIIQEDISTVEAQVYVAMVVDTKLGILSYLSNLSSSETQSEHSNHGNISQSFAILEYLVDYFPMAVEPHAHNITRWCLGMLLQENILRIPSLKFLKEIIRKCPCTNVDLKYLVDKLMDFLEANKKLTGTSTLRQTVLVILGEICATHPDAIAHASDLYLNIILRYLNEYEVSKYKSNILVEGCFCSLIGYATNFSLPDDKKEFIFKHVKSFCCLGDSGERHTANRAALTFYNKHISYFSSLIYKEPSLIKTLSKWVDGNQSPEHKKLGLAALSLTYRQIVSILNNSSGDEGKEYFTSIKNDLETLLKTENNSVYHHKHAVVGLAELSSLFIKFGLQAELVTIVGKFIGYSEATPEYETWSISIYVEAQAKIVAVLENPLLELAHLSRLSVLLFERYPKIPSNFRLGAAEALESSFMSLSVKDIQVFNHHVRMVLYQGLIRCCSNQLYVDTLLVNSVSFKSFLPLWVHLLTIKSRTGSSLVGSVVYDCFITVFLELISKLDLTLMPGVVECSDPSLAFEAKAPNDFLIFINMVDLFQEVIPSSDHGLLHKWLSSVSCDILKLSQKLPLISGFYKVLAVVFEVASGEFSMDSSLSLDGILIFLRDCLSRVTMFKDDLQISCLRMILRAPICLIVNLLDCLDIALLAAMRIGSGYPELLELSVSSLDRWLSKISPRKMKPLLEKVLPFMSSLLQSPGNDQRCENLLTLSKGSLSSKKKFRRRVIAPSERRSLSLQKQFILFLGKLEPEMYSALTKPVGSSVFSFHNPLCYKLPLRDSRPDLQLNAIIPHIISSAMSAADRSIRVTACEVLHSILLIVIEGTQKPDSDAELLRNLLQSALRLSCDPDKVIRDLFNPLLLQTCRYFSGKVQMLSKGTAAVVEVLNEGCTHEYDSSLRDFSAECMREFIIWSRKQNPDTYALSPVNVSAVIRSICTFSSHPDRSKRLGASVIFNNIYREIREDTTVMSVYWFQLFHSFTCSLNLCDDEESARVVLSSLEHIRRPIIEMKHIFLYLSDNRRVPNGFRGGTLRDLAVYIFNLCRSLNVHLREFARSMFLTVFKLLPGIHNVKEFLISNQVTLDLNNKCPDTENGFALLDYVNWLVDQEAVDLDFMTYPELLNLRNSLLKEVLKLPNNRSSSLFCLLRFCRNTVKTMGAEDGKNLAFLLFKIDVALVVEFVDLLLAVRLNISAINGFTTNLPLIDTNLLKAKLKEQNSVSFFLAFEVLDKSSMLTQTFIGDDILLLLFDVLFLSFGRRVTVRFLDPSFKDQLGKMFAFAVKCGITFNAFDNCLRDKTQVNFEGKLCSKGEIFLLNFKTQIVRYLTAFEAEALLGLDKDGIKFLIVVLECFLETNQTVDYNDYACKYLLQWDTITQMVEPDKETLLVLLKLLTAHKPFGIITDFKKSSNWLLSLISSKEKANPHIQHAFELLSHLSSKMENCNESLDQSLTTFRRNQSILYDVGPYTSRSEHSFFIKAIYRGLLLSLKHTGSLVILKFTVENISSHLGLVSSEEFDSLLYYILKSFPEDHTLKMAETLFSLAIGSTVNMETVCFIRERLAALFQFFSEHLILTFYGSHITQLYKIIVDESSDANGRQGLRNRITCVRLLEALYLKSSQQLRIEIQNRNLSIPNLFKNIINKCSSWSMPGNDSELWRLYNCACVKLLGAVVCQTSNERNYEVLLFKLPIWNGVTDHVKKYNFDMDFTKLPVQKKLLTGIRQASIVKKTPLLYPSSQVLFESSLREDVTKFDLSNSFISQLPVSQAERQDGVRTVELELDALNEHEIIPTICGVVEHMIAEGITPDGKVPCWLTSFLKFLKNQSSSDNSKLLVLKVIFNLQTHVNRYAEQATPIILQSIIYLQSNTPSNYFIMDLIMMLLQWDTNLEGHENLVTLVLENIVTRPNTVRKDIMKYISDNVKILVEKWKHLIDKARITSFLLCRLDNNDEFVTYVNLSIVSVFLPNGIFLVEKQSVEKLINWLLLCIKAENKNFQFASEVLGLALSSIQHIQDFNALKETVFSAVLSINQKKSKIDSHDIILLYSIHKFYPFISSNEFVSSNLEVRILRDSSSVRQNCLEMLLSHVQRGNSLQEPKYLISEALKSNVPVVIDLTIQILKEIINKIDPQELEEILEQIIKLTSSSTAQVRLKSCETLALILQNQRNMCVDRLKCCEMALVKKLNDTDDEVRKVCERFLYDLRFSSKTWEEQLLYIIRDLYSPDAETDFITYASSLIMTIASRSFDFDRAMFDRPLAECTYSDYKVLVSWRVRHSSLAPMFAPSIAGELQRLDFDRPIAPSAFHEQIRATARSLLFSATLTDEPALNIQSRSSGMEIEDELDEGVFKKPKAPFRFFKTGNNSRAIFARRAVAARDRAEADVHERIKRRETDVKIFKNYRKGDYPDIEMNHSDFILPLSHLARKDALLAKQILLNLFSSITSDTFWNEVSSTLNDVLQRTSYFDSTFLSFVFQLSLERNLSLDSENVCIAAKSSGLVTLGTLVIEGHITDYYDGGSSSAKKKRNIEDESSERWLHLAQLYQELHDSDGQQGIFLDKLEVQGEAYEGIQYEAAYNWVSALKSYEDALKDSVSDVRAQFYFQAYLKCLANLGDWSSVNRGILGNLKSKENVWEDPWGSETVLPLLLRSELMTSLENDTSDFQNFVRDFSSVSTLSSRFPLELTLASWMDSNYPKTLTYFNQACLAFLTSWSQINNWDSKRKEDWLVSLQLLSEVNEIVEYSSATSKEAALMRTLENWKNVIPGKICDFQVWDARLALRKKLCSFVENSMSGSDVNELKESVRLSQTVLTERALDMEQFHIAKKYLKVSKTSIADGRWLYCRDATSILGIKLNQIEPEMKIAKYFETWQKIEFNILNAMDDNSEDPLLPAKVRQTVMKIISSISSLVEEHNIDLNLLPVPGNKRDLKQSWLTCAHEIINLLVSDNQADLDLRGDVYVDIAKFHRRNKGLPNDILKAILRGMKYGNKEARQLFCWVLTIEDLQGSAEDVVECTQIPSWMFLLWRHQLLAYLANGNSLLVKSIIKRIALDYPKALSHSLRISLESLENQKNMAFIQEIKNLVLSDPSDDAFINAISKVVVPPIKMRYYVEKVLDACNDIVTVKEELRKVQNIAFAADNGDTYRCLNAYRDNIQAMMESENLGDIKEDLKSLMSDMGKLSASIDVDKLLKMYSPWLSSFLKSTSTNNLEIPGQYEEDCEPRVNSHIKIAGFKPELICLASKRRPFKITLLGDDAKEYSFLFKFGEDLRQDERIQQVLKQMQCTLKAKKLTMDLELQSFKVVPLMSSCGLIEWLELAVSLRDLVSSTIPYSKISEAQHKHLLFLGGGDSQIRPVRAYVRAFSQVSDEKAIAEYQNRIRAFPECALRSALWRPCSSPEQMVHIRRNFAKSMAAMSIAHWLIGVGDRHEENILVSTESGKAIGIDFGVAFGFGTQFLIPPELVPFRLTPQIINTFSPLKESGWVKQAMIRTLRVLRENPSVLLAMLEVFVLEPSLDWKLQAERLGREHGVEQFSYDFYPRQKVNAVERKLGGIHPGREFVVDLSSGHKDHPCLDRFLTILQGKAGKNVRHNFGESNLSPEQQVECLIDLATDPLILSFTYVGWNPWL